MTIGAGPVEFHANGLAKIYCFSPAVYLGYTSEAGVQLEMDPKFAPIYTDAYGDQVPEDIQNMSMIATLNFELIKWDQTVLAALQVHATEKSGAPGTLDVTVANALGNAPTTDAASIGNANPSNYVGSFFKQCGWTFPVIIQRALTACEVNTEPGAGGNPSDHAGYAFGTCYVGLDSFNLGTRATRHRLTIHCLPNASGQLFTIASA